MKKPLFVKISIVWCAEDVIQQAKAKEIKLSPEEISDCLSLMESNHDATIGINWDVIDCYINQIVSEREPEVNRVKREGRY